MVKRSFVVLILAVAFITNFASAKNLEVFVSSSGNDGADGSELHPVATLAGAVEKLKSLCGENFAGRASIKFFGGVYRFSDGVTIDNSSKRLPLGGLSIEPSSPSEKVVFHGGKTFDSSVFTEVKDADILALLPPEKTACRLYSVDLKTNGLVNCGKLTRRCFKFYDTPTQAEVFIDGLAKPRGRYPNGEGWIEIGNVVQAGGRRVGADSVFHFPENFDRPKRWLSVSRLWLSGRFSAGYADDLVRVKKIDIADRTFTIEAPEYGVFPGKTALAKIKNSPYEHKISENFRGYAAYNLLEEIDAEGEYFVDVDRGAIFIALSHPEKIGRVDISLLDRPFITFDNISNVEVRGIDFCYSRAQGIRFGKVDGLKIEKCAFYNLGMQGVSNTDWIIPQKTHRTPSKFSARNVRISDSDFYELGCGGAYIGGGDLTSLRPSGNSVENCRFRRTTRINRTYAPAIWIAGFGGTIANNTICDNDHEAIAFNGSEYKIRRNRIFDVCKIGMDEGAIYTGRNVYYRGNIIEENLFENIGNNSEHHIHAIYMDDCTSGAVIRRNIFVRSGSKKGNTVNFNKGFDHTICDNLFVECAVPIKEYTKPDRKILTALERESRNIVGSEGLKIYMERYPECVDIVKREQVNVIFGNAYFRCTKLSAHVRSGGRIISDDGSAKIGERVLTDIVKYFPSDKLARDLASIKFGAKCK